MRLGKLTNEQLKRLVLDRFCRTRNEVVAGSAIGEDCAAIDLQGELCVLSTDPITAATGNIGTLAVHVCCNDAAACGADGLIVEVHNDPAHALCDGAQSLTPEQFDALTQKVAKVREALK